MNWQKIRIIALIVLVMLAAVIFLYAANTASGQVLTEPGPDVPTGTLQVCVYTWDGTPVAWDNYDVVPSSGEPFFGLTQTNGCSGELDVAAGPAQVTTSAGQKTITVKDGKEVTAVFYTRAPYQSFVSIAR